MCVCRVKIAFAGEVFKNWPSRRFPEGFEFMSFASSPVQAEAETWFQRGNTARAEGRLEEAVACFSRATALNAGHFAAWFARGMALHDLKRFEEAAASYSQAAGLASQSPELYLNRGAMWLDAGKFEAALADFDRALALRRNFPEAQVNRGNALKALGRLEEALVVYDRLLVNHPDLAGAHNNRGNVLQDLGRPAEALAAYERALRLDPGLADAWNNRGNVLQTLRRFDEAVAAYDRLLQLAPGFASGYCARGNALKALRRLEEALAAYDRALDLRPAYGEAWTNRGCTLLDLGRYAEAMDCFDRALEVDGDQAAANHNRGLVLLAGGHPGAAADSYERALKARPDLALILGSALNARMQLCDWDGFDDRLNALKAALAAGQPVANPFVVQALIDDPDLQLKAARAMVAARFPPAAASVAAAKRAIVTRERIRLAYISSDFRDHPVSHLMAAVLEHHDRGRVEVFAVSIRPAEVDPWRARIIAGVDRFIYAERHSPADIAAQCRALGIDIAIDLNGFTGDSAPAIFAERAAPVQVGYIGYLGTTGAPYFDYVIADPVLIPEAEMAFYSEKIAYIPSYQANDDRLSIASAAPSRAELGLPEDGFVFCSFNQAYKITPEVFGIWMRLLKRVPKSVLWLHASNPEVAPNLRREASRRGVDPDRLVFAAFLPLDRHLARLKRADLFLDTAPYNSGATASNALRAGVPMVTRIGRAFASRMAASLLQGAGLPELVTTSADAYEDLAVALANDAACLAMMRRKLAANLPTCRLFDTRATTRSLEAAYAAMHARAQQGLPPEHIRI